MLSGLIEVCARNRFLVFTGVLLLTLAGIWSLNHVPLDTLPDISDMQAAVSSDVGSDVMKPIAAPIVGGMITSTIHVLILVPAFFLMVQERTHKARFTTGAKISSATIAS